MSVRPQGPSSRPLQAMSRHAMPGVLPYHLQAEAPRLKERSLVSRLAFGALCLACCGGAFVVILTVWQFWFPEAPFIGPVASQQQQPVHDLHAAGAASHTFVSVHGAPEPLHRRKPVIQRSVIQRLAMLKRATGGKGVDMIWTRQLFPHWFQPGTEGGEERLDVQATLSDLILAVAYLAQAEIDE